MEQYATWIRDEAEDSKVVSASLQHLLKAAATLTDEQWVCRIPFAADTII
jgi:hypothetical protein